MSYRVIVDSCGELTLQMKESGIFKTASLSMEVDGFHILDDETFDQADFLKRVAECPECPKSACPSPERYMRAFDCEAEHVYAVTLSAELSGSCPSPERYMELYKCDVDRVYAVTLSEELSGSYNSALLGEKLYKEEGGEEKIHVFNSRSASVGETLIGRKIQECEEAGMDFEQVVETVEAYIEEQHTYFVLENLDTLRKNGRLTGLKSLVVSALNIKPVMGSTPEGTICQLDKSRGMKKALAKMAEHVAKDAVKPEEKILAIAHCNCPERAEAVRKLILEKVKVKDSFIVDTAGISSMYANDGGIIVVL